MNITDDPMTPSPAKTDDQSDPAPVSLGPTGRGTRTVLLAIATTIVIATAVTDFLTAGINLSILYCVPMAVFVRTATPASIWRITGLLVFLTYAGFFIGPAPNPGLAWHDMFDWYRVANRTIAAASVIAIAAMAHFGIILRRRLDRRWDPDNLRHSDLQVFQEVVDSFDRFKAASTAVIAMAAVAFVDFLVPPQFNPSIVYAVPILACARVRVRRFLWAMVALTFLLIYAGFYIGITPTLTDVEVVTRNIRNRRLTCLMVFCIGAFVHLLIGIDAPLQRRGRGPHVSSSTGVPAEH